MGPAVSLEHGNFPLEEPFICHTRDSIVRSHVPQLAGSYIILFGPRAPRLRPL